MATQPVKDVRPILNSFQDKSNIVSEFEVREARLREQWKKDHGRGGQPNAGNFLAKLMGMPTSEPKDAIGHH